MAQRAETPYVGCAGWSIPKPHAARFPAEGSHLQRYAQRLRAVEINSSFYRPHRPTTYARWAASVPEDFRFAVKLPKEISHQRRLVDAAGPLTQFLDEASALGDRLGPLLLQLPPSLGFDPAIAEPFLELLRSLHGGPIVAEPRHASWFAAQPEQLLARLRIARVAADPAPHPGADEPGGWRGLSYFRWHGSPRIYYSDYDAAALDRFAAAVIRSAGSGPVWCIFDNTALGAATANAFDLLARLAGDRCRPFCRLASPRGFEPRY